MGENFDFRFISQLNAKQGISHLGTDAITSLFKKVSEAVEILQNNCTGDAINPPDASAASLSQLACIIRVINLFSCNSLLIKKTGSFDEPLQQYEADKKHLKKLDIKRFFEEDLIEIRRLYIEKHKDPEENAYSFKLTRPNGSPVNIDASKLNEELINRIEIFDSQGKKAGYLNDLTEKCFKEMIRFVEDSNEMLCLENLEFKSCMERLKESFRFDIGVNLPVVKNKIVHGLSKALSTRNLNLN
jgi:hypothetical protein